MSEENVEILRAGYQAFQRGDLETALAFMDPEIRITDHDRVLDTPSEYQGPQGVLQMTMEAAETFDEHRYEPEEFTAAGNRVLVSVRRRGRGKGSGIEIDEAQWHVWDFEDGKAIQFQVFVSREPALEATRMSR
jgi:ketosteroid isomerase-like protein